MKSLDTAQFWKAAPLFTGKHLTISEIQRRSTKWKHISCSYKNKTKQKMVFSFISWCLYRTRNILHFQQHKQQHRNVEKSCYLHFISWPCFITVSLVNISLYILTRASLKPHLTEILISKILLVRFQWSFLTLLSILGQIYTMHLVGLQISHKLFHSRLWF